MAVLKMCKINICAMKKDRKKILELLQLKGCLEVHEEVKEDKVFEKVNTATQISLYERQAALTDNALEILEVYIPEEKSMLSSLEGKKVISSDDYYKIVNKRNEINGLVNDIIEQKKSIDEKESGKQKCLFSGNQKHRIYGGRDFRFIYGTGVDKKNRKLKRISKITVYADSFGGQISDLCNRILYEI